MKWNTLLYGLLFSGLGIFSYLLLVNYTELTPKVADVLYSKGAFVFFIAALNVLGYSTLRISSWINNQYALNIRHRWKITATYLVVTLLFLLLNYGLLITAKLLVGLPNLFTFSKFDLWDPEVDTAVGTKYPIMKSFSVGFDVNF